MRPGQQLVQGGTAMRAPSLCAGTVDTLGFLTPGPSILHTQAQAQGLKCWQRGNIKRLPSKLNVLPSGSRGHGGRPWRIPKEPWTRGMHWVPFSPLLVFHAMCPTEAQGLVGVTHQTWIHNLPPEERLQANHGHSETHPSERERENGQTGHLPLPSGNKKTCSRFWVG